MHTDATTVTPAKAGIHRRQAWKEMEVYRRVKQFRSGSAGLKPAPAAAQKRLILRRRSFLEDVPQQIAFQRGDAPFHDPFKSGHSRIEGIDAAVYSIDAALHKTARRNGSDDCRR